MPEFRKVKTLLGIFALGNWGVVSGFKKSLPSIPLENRKVQCHSVEYFSCDIQYVQNMWTLI